MRRSTFRRLVLGGGLFAFLACLGLYWAWVDGRLIRWVENWVVRQYLKEIEPQLPFKIRSVDVDAPWEDFKRGRIRRFSILLEREPVRVRLEGPLDIRPQETRRGTEYAVFFESLETRFEWKTNQEWKASSPFALVFWIQANRGLNRLAELGMKLFAPRLELPLFHTVAENVRLQSEWDESSGSLLRTHFEAPLIRYQESDSRLGELKGLTGEAELPLAFFPFALGEKASLRMRAAHVEALLDPYYVDTSLDEAPLSLAIDLKEGRPAQAALMAGKASQGQFEVKLTPEYTSQDALQLKALGVSLQIARMPLAPFFKIAQGFPELASVIDLNLPNGHLDFSLGGSIPFLENGAPPSPWDTRGMLAPWLEAWRGNLSIRNLSVLWQRLAVAVRGVRLSLPFDLRGGGQEGSFQAERLAFRRWEGVLPRIPFSLVRNRDAAREVLRLDLPRGLKLENRQGLSLEIPSLMAKFRPGQEDLFEVRTGLQLQKSSLEPWVQAMCLPLDPVPPAEVEVDLPRIVVYPDAIEPRGALRLRAFHGELEVTDIGVYEWTGSVPELDFSVSFGGFLLEKLGPWLNFGKMEGVLQGYANNVTIVGPVPTNYDFRIELKPTRGERVVFSPQAMKNFVRMVAGADTLNEVPWPGEWLYFGWPREVLGGYDVKYAGLTAFASGGSILVETLDPPGSKEHFILKSSSAILDKDTFSVKLASRSYPAVLDAEGVRSVVSNIVAVARNLAQSKLDNASVEEKPCLPKEFDESK